MQLRFDKGLAALRFSGHGLLIGKRCGNTQGGDDGLLARVQVLRLGGAGAILGVMRGVERGVGDGHAAVLLVLDAALNGPALG